MISIPCRCGATSKNFYSKIGPFYIDECCEAAGYDHLGNKVEGAPAQQPATVDDVVEIAVETDEAEAEEAQEEVAPIQDEDEAAKQEDPRPEASEKKEAELPRTRSGRRRNKAEDSAQ